MEGLPKRGELIALFVLHNAVMKRKLIMPAVFLIVSIALILAGDFVTSWRNFLIGALFALSARDVGEAVIKYVLGRKA